ncbi:MAG: M28 family metallopeptidase, partial [Candidatus Thorarchaeota archaeon]
MPRFLIICLHVLILMATAILPARIALASDDSVAPNLYRVSVLSHRDAEILAELDVNAIHRVRDGYLVLAPEGTEIAFTRAGIDWIRVATAVDCNRLALDISHDPALRAECPVIFEEPGTRIYLVDSPDVISSQRGRSLAPIRIRNLPITYPSPPAFNKSAAIPSGALDSLVNGISQDSLVAYSDHLESYNGRVAGTSGGLMSALWSANKFSEYGCDSVVIDTFTETLDGEPKLCRNVLAYKIGLEFPHHHIIIGAHRDTEPGCPGADDNGSGTAAVLEVARSMADIETRTTVVFALFDAEEYGLLGAWHYAQRAFEHDEKIPFMLNMDMIAHFENTDQAHLYCEDRDSAYARVWADMADSIPTINLTGHLSGWFGSSDHVPFQDYGYPALFVHEYIRSTVYHTSRDSTVYLNYDYFTRMTKASGATAYVVDQQFVPEYDIQVYPVGDYPNLVYPGVSTPISIGIHTFGGAEILPGDVHLVYSVNDGEEQSVSMSPIGDDAYTADLPQLSCLDNIAYRIRIEEDSLGIFYYPFAGAFIRAFSATDILYLFNEDFSEDLGWTVTGDAVAAGQWMLSDNIESGIWGAPDGDFDGNGFCYVTGKTPGSDVDYGTSILTSPAVDVTASTCLLEYARWYSNDYGGLSDGEVFNIDLSTDNGVTWLPIDSAGPVDQASGGWNLISFRLEDLISLPADVQLRF